MDNQLAAVSESSRAVGSHLLDCPVRRVKAARCMALQRITTPPVLEPVDCLSRGRHPVHPVLPGNRGSAHRSPHRGLDFPSTRSKQPRTLSTRPFLLRTGRSTFSNRSRGVQGAVLASKVQEPTAHFKRRGTGREQLVRMPQTHGNQRWPRGYCRQLASSAGTPSSARNRV